MSSQYATTEEAVATRAAIHGVKWPPSNPKVLSVDFSEQDEVTDALNAKNFTSFLHTAVRFNCTISLL